jgi:hypothetical protein
MILLSEKPCSWSNPGLTRTRIGANFEKFYMKTIFKSKINLTRKTLNVVSVQWSYMQASPILWDYPFNSSLRKGLACAANFYFLEIPNWPKNLARSWKHWCIIKNKIFRTMLKICHSFWIFSCCMIKEDSSLWSPRQERIQISRIIDLYCR